MSEVRDWTPHRWAHPPKSWSMFISTFPSQLGLRPASSDLQCSDLFLQHHKWLFLLWKSETILIPLFAIGGWAGGGVIEQFVSLLLAFILLTTAGPLLLAPSSPLLIPLAFHCNLSSFTSSRLIFSMCNIRQIWFALYPLGMFEDW